MSELIVFQGHEFRVRRRPDFITRIRARLAWRAYQKAERPYLHFAREFEALEAQREAAVAKYGSWSGKVLQKTTPRLPISGANWTA